MNTGTQLRSRNGKTTIVVDAIFGDIAHCTFTRAGRSKFCKVYLATLRKYYEVIS